MRLKTARTVETTTEVTIRRDELLEALKKIVPGLDAVESSTIRIYCQGYRSQIDIDEEVPLMLTYGTKMVEVE